MKNPGDGPGRAGEWRTLLVVLAVYGGWLILTWYHAQLPAVVLFASGGWLICWHGSLQHETIHGHPTRNSRINALVGGWPLALWLPYGSYRRSHRDHHQAHRPTHPDCDPESRYVLSPVGWRYWAATVESALAGRLVLGPFLALARFVAEEARRLPQEPAIFLKDWAWHGAGLCVVFHWLDRVDLSPWRYIALFVLPGLALTLLRGFAEHRAASPGPSRAATVESRGPLALLFLNNNLHAAHHERPEIAWYALPAVERQRATAAEPRYRGYREVFRRFLFVPHDHVRHPDAGTQP